jgi:flavin reductase (DIM6/NTAB) family NADH-FMN oxidoreductase RutF
MNEKIDTKALNNIGYGLYVVTTEQGGKDNGLIVNTVMQLTQDPLRVGVCVNKANFSHDTILKSGKMNVNCLSQSAPFSVFETFGFKSGRDTDKFAGCTPLRSANGLVYLPKHINAYISLEVAEYVDLGTHGLFICDVTESRVLSADPSMTYAYYHKNVKPKPKTESATKGYVCTICGYIHAESELPQDFVCPICKHGADDFVPIG